MKDKSNHDNDYGSTNHNSADANTDADAAADVVFPFSISNLLPSSRMNMILSTSTSDDEQRLYNYLL